MTADPAADAALFRKVAWRLLPILTLGYFLAFLDRANAGFAALRMNDDIGIGPAAFGFGASLFFVGYLVFEVPSNLLLEKVGARRWIARIMVSWGLVSAAMCLVRDVYSFYALRLLLGVAEAGFYPGVILYLGYWFPADRRARIVAILMLAVPVSTLIGSPISAGLLDWEGRAGLHGWQWMFLLEAAPAILLGIAAWRMLPDRPAEAAWLTATERIRLLACLQPGREKRDHPATPLLQALTDRRTLVAAIVYAGGSGASACLTLWTPQVLHGFGLSTTQTGWLNAVPYALAVPAMLWWAHRSDRTGERAWHTFAPLALIAVALALLPLTSNLAWSVGLISLAVIGAYAMKAPFWALVGALLPEGIAAAGIAQINAIGNLGGLLATTAVGAIKQGGGSYGAGMLPLAAIAAASAVTVLVLAINRVAAATPPPGADRIR